MQRKVFSLFSVIVLLLAAGGLAGIAPLAALAAPNAMLTVTDASDLGDANPGDGACDTDPGTAGDQCSLRAAIQEVDALGAAANPHHIEFNIPGAGPFTIGPASALPEITVPVIIAGETQPGTTCPTAANPAHLMIVLDGSAAGAGAIGLVLNTGSDGSTLRGLVVGDFNSYGLRINTNNNAVRCSHIGVGQDGVSDMGNGSHGILVNGDDNTIGGLLAYAQRNVISGNAALGIYITGGDNNQIAGNYIGTTADGMNALNNGSGIYVSGSGNIIGGKAELHLPNVISANLGYGVRINSSPDNIVWGNIIGATRDPRLPLGNGGDGIEVLGDASGTQVGGTGYQEPNIIANNGMQGVVLQDNVAGEPVSNTVRGNAIYNNGLLGIDLGGDGVDLNDAGDADTGENERQNSPVLMAVSGSLVVTATLDSLPSTIYMVDIYGNDSCDASGSGEGQVYLGGTEVATDGAGHADFTLNIPLPPPPMASGRATAALEGFVTATATDPAGSTSEFSACLDVAPPPPALDWSLFLPLVIR